METGGRWLFMTREGHGISKGGVRGWGGGGVMHSQGRTWERVGDG